MSDATNTPADAGTPPAEGTALQQGAAEQTHYLPEKYQVKGAGGALDLEASSRKLADAYGHLEKRVGSGELPPKLADEYQVQVPEAFKEVWDEKDPGLLAFRKDAHAAGLTQKQFDFVMGQYFNVAPQLVNGSRQLSVEECATALRQEWKDDATYNAELGKAYKAAVGYGGGEAEGIIRDYGNDPRIVRLLARIGGELGEDQAVNPGGGSAGAPSVDALMASEAYANPKHADHARVSQQVREHFQRQEAKARRAGAAPVL